MTTTLAVPVSADDIVAALGCDPDDPIDPRVSPLEGYAAYLGSPAALDERDDNDYGDHCHCDGCARIDTQIDSLISSGRATWGDVVELMAQSHGAPTIIPLGERA